MSMPIARPLAAASLLAMLLAAPPIPAAAQMTREHDAASLRSFHGGGSRIRRSFRSDAEAQAVLRQVLAAAGLAGMEDRIIIRASAETDNAEAYIENNERLIFYNAVFMQEIAAKTKNYWSMVAILAHEVGHHVRFHTALPGREHEFELEADYQAGFILRRMGAKLEEAQAPFRTFPAAATKTHPGGAQRLQAVTLGWTDGGAGPAPGWPGTGPGTGPAAATGAGPGTVAAAPPVVPSQPAPPPKTTPAVVPAPAPAPSPSPAVVPPGTAPGTLVRTLVEHVGGVSSVAVSPDGRTIVTGGGDDTVKVWEAASGRLVRTLAGHGDAVRSVAVSPDGRTIVSGGGEGGEVKVWEAASGRLVRTLEAHRNRALSVAVSPNGRWLASGGCDQDNMAGECTRGEVKIWALQ